jgi:FKBP-type peptidyl-prolyl cis-trans isomerase FklB
MERKLTMGVKEDGVKYLQDNMKREEVQVTPSGLQYEVIKEGTGASPKATDTVEVHYKGTFIDGTTFDSSYDRGQTISFPLNRVIKGWTEGLQLMKEGGHYKFVIPYNLAYGEGGAGAAIPGFSTLIFEVELFKVK